MTVALSTPLRRNNSAAAGREVLTAPDIAAGAPEFALSDSDFARVRKLIYQRAGINLQDGKQAMVYGRLSRRLRETEHLSFGSYLDSLEALSGTSANGEWQLFINCLTTNLTSFFREPHHFTALHEVLQKRRSSTTRIWCSAASTGEEPYSLAITALDALDARAQVLDFQRPAGEELAPLVGAVVPYVRGVAEVVGLLTRLSHVEVVDDEPETKK